MDSLSKKLQNLGIHDIRNAARFAQNVIVQYEPYQIDIRRATNTDSWGPTPKHLAKVLRNRYQVPMYLMTEYILKRLIDHIAQRPKNLYEKARKQYVNYGSEWRVVLKCLVVLEFLLLNVDDGDELNQIKSCLNAHKHILTREVNNFKIKFSNDGKMEVHERGIKKKNELILQYLDDPHFLKRERLKNKKNSLKIKNNNTAGGATSSSGRYNHPSFSGDHVMDTVQGIDYNYDYDDDDDDDDDFEDYATSNRNKRTDLDDFDDEFNEFTVGTTQPSSGRGTTTTTSSSSSFATHDHNVATHNRRNQVTSLEEQRRQRREILRERIRASERQRKTREQVKLQQQQQQEDIPDLLDLDFDSTPATDTNTNTKNNNSSNNLSGIPISGTTSLNVFSSSKSKDQSEVDDDDDDGFGDFQSETSTTTTNNNNNTNNASSTLNDLLNGNKINTTSSSNNKTTSLNDKDLFADLFNNSKSLI